MVSGLGYGSMHSLFYIRYRQFYSFIQSLSSIPISHRQYNAVLKLYKFKIHNNKQKMSGHSAPNKYKAEVVRLSEMLQNSFKEIQHYKKRDSEFEHMREKFIREIEKLQEQNKQLEQQKDYYKQGSQHDPQGELKKLKNQYESGVVVNKAKNYIEKVNQIIRDIVAEVKNCRKSGQFNEGNLAELERMFAKASMGVIKYQQEFLKQATDKELTRAQIDKLRKQNTYMYEMTTKLQQNFNQSDRITKKLYTELKHLRESNAHLQAEKCSSQAEIETLKHKLSSKRTTTSSGQSPIITGHQISSPVGSSTNNSEFSTLNLQTQRNQKQMKELKENNYELEVKIKELQQENNRLRKQTEILNKSVPKNDAISFRNIKQVTIRDSQGQNEVQQEDQREQLHQQIRILKSELHNSQKIAHKLQKQLSKLKVNSPSRSPQSSSRSHQQTEQMLVVDPNSQQILALQRKISELSKQIEHSEEQKDKIITVYQNESYETKDKMIRQQDAIMEMDKVIRQLKSKNQQAGRSHRAISKESNDRLSQIERLRQQLEDKDEEIRVLNEEKQTWQQKNENGNENNQKEQQKQQLMKQEQKSQEQHSQQQDLLTNSRNNMNPSQSNLNLDQQLLNLQQILKQKQQQLLQTQQKLAQKDQELLKLHCEHEKESLISQLNTKSLQDQNQALQSSVSHLQAMNSNLQDAISEYQHQQDELALLQQDVKSKERIVARLEEQLSEVNREINEIADTWGITDNNKLLHAIGQRYRKQMDTIMELTLNKERAINQSKSNEIWYCSEKATITKEKNQLLRTLQTILQQLCSIFRLQMVVSPVSVKSPPRKVRQAREEAESGGSMVEIDVSMSEYELMEKWDSIQQMLQEYQQSLAKQSATRQQIQASWWTKQAQLRQQLTSSNQMLVSVQDKCKEMQEYINIKQQQVHQIEAKVGEYMAKQQAWKAKNVEDNKNDRPDDRHDHDESIVQEYNADSITIQESHIQSTEQAQQQQGQQQSDSALSHNVQPDPHRQSSQPSSCSAYSSLQQQLSTLQTQLEQLQKLQNLNEATIEHMTSQLHDQQSEHRRKLAQMDMVIKGKQDNITKLEQQIQGYVQRIAMLQAAHQEHHAASREVQVELNSIISQVAGQADRQQSEMLLDSSNTNNNEQQQQHQQQQQQQQQSQSKVFAMFEQLPQQSSNVSESVMAQQQQKQLVYSVSCATPIPKSAMHPLSQFLSEPSIWQAGTSKQQDKYRQTEVQTEHQQQPQPKQQQLQQKQQQQEWQLKLTVTQQKVHQLQQQIAQLKQKHRSEMVRVLQLNSSRYGQVQQQILNTRLDMDQIISNTMHDIDGMCAIVCDKLLEHERMLTNMETVLQQQQIGMQTQVIALEYAEVNTDVLQQQQQQLIRGQGEHGEAQTQTDQQQQHTQIQTETQTQVDEMKQQYTQQIKQVVQQEYQVQVGMIVDTIQTAAQVVMQHQYTNCQVQTIQQKQQYNNQGEQQQEQPKQQKVNMVDVQSQSSPELQHQHMQTTLPQPTPHQQAQIQCSISELVRDQLNTVLIPTITISTALQTQNNHQHTQTDSIAAMSPRSPPLSPRSSIEQTTAFQGLQSKLAGLTSLTEELQLQIGTYKQQHQDSLYQFVKYEQEIDRYQTNMAQLSSRVRDLEREVDDAAEQRVSKDIELQDLRQANQLLSKQIKRVDGHKRRLEHQLKQHDQMQSNEIQKLQHSFNTLQQSHDCVSRMLSNAGQQISQCPVIKQIVEGYQAKVQNLNKVMDNKITEHSQRIDVILGNLTQMRQEWSNLEQKQIRKGTKQMQVLLKQIKQLQQLVQSLQQQTSDKTAKLIESKVTTTTLQSNLTELTTSCQAKTVECNELQLKLSYQTSQIETITSSLEEQQEAVVKLKEELGQVKGQVGLLEREIVEANLKAQEAENKLKDSESKLQRRDKQLAIVKDSLNKNEQTVQLMTKQINMLKVTLSDKQQQCTLLLTQQQQTQLQLEASQQTYKLIQQQNSQLHATIQQHDGKMQEMVGQIGSKDGVIRELNAKIEALRCEIEELNVRMLKIVEDGQLQVQAETRRVNALLIQIKQKDNQINRLQQEVANDAKLKQHRQNKQFSISCVETIKIQQQKQQPVQSLKQFVQCEIQTIRIELFNEQQHEQQTQTQTQTRIKQQKQHNVVKQQQNLQQYARLQILKEQLQQKQQILIQRQHEINTNINKIKCMQEEYIQKQQDKENQQHQYLYADYGQSNNQRQQNMILDYAEQQNKHKQSIKPAVKMNKTSLKNQPFIELPLQIQPKIDIKMEQDQPKRGLSHRSTKQQALQKQLKIVEQYREILQDENNNLKKQIIRKDKACAKMRELEKSLTSAKKSIEKLQAQLALKERLVVKYDREMKNRAEQFIKTKRNLQNLVEELELEKKRNKNFEDLYEKYMTHKKSVAEAIR